MGPCPAESIPGQWTKCLTLVRFIWHHSAAPSNVRLLQASGARLQPLTAIWNLGTTVSGGLCESRTPRQAVRHSTTEAKITSLQRGLQCYNSCLNALRCLFMVPIPVPLRSLRSTPLMPPLAGSAATGPASLLQIVEGRVISVLNGQRWETKLHSP
jgi:hypothetical protein